MKLLDSIQRNSVNTTFPPPAPTAWASRSKPGSIRATPTYSNAGLLYDQTIDIYSGGDSLSLLYAFTYDDILRPERTSLTFGAAPERLISRLTYNAKDLVNTKLSNFYFEMKD